MAKKIYYYKFLIRVNEKLPKIVIDGIKEAIFLYLGYIPRGDIHGGEANNNGYHKFKTEYDFKLDNKRC